MKKNNSKGGWWRDPERFQKFLNNNINNNDNNNSYSAIQLLSN